MAKSLHSEQHYARRLERVTAYIDAHLADALPLASLAEQAAFSPFHFHRVFCAYQGETPQAYIRRRRLERGAALLRYGPSVCVMDIAPQCGFKSVEAFDRAFHDCFGMTPSHWRHGGYAQWTARPAPPIPSGLTPDQVKVRLMPSTQTVYQRKVGPYGDGQDQIWAQLAELVAPFNLSGNACYGTGIDDPAVTPEGHCRFDACVQLPMTEVVPRHLPVKVLTGGRYAVLDYEGPAGQSEGHWRWLLQTWLPQSGFQISAHSCFERFPHGIPTHTPVRSELCLPLRI